jgi:hypothetical protein
MATRDEIADAIAGMTLFADLATPQLMGVASQFEEAFFPQGAKVLRQGISGSAFYVIMDGEAAVDGDQRATSGRGGFFGGSRSSWGSADRHVIATRPLRCIVLQDSRGPSSSGIRGHVRISRPSPPARNATGCRLTAVADAIPDAGRPLPAGAVPCCRGLGPGRPPGQLLPGPGGNRPRGDLGRSRSRRHVPALAVLPAPAVVDEAVRSGGPAQPCLRALGLELPDRRQPSSAASRPGSRLLGLPVRPE